MPMRLPLVELVVTGISAGVQITLLPSVSTAERTGIVTAKTEQVKRLKDLELENSRLRKAVSDLTLDKLILQEAARGNF